MSAFLMHRKLEERVLFLPCIQHWIIQLHQKCQTDNWLDSLCWNKKTWYLKSFQILLASFHGTMSWIFLEKNHRKKVNCLNLATFPVAPSFSFAVRFLWTVGIAFVCDDLIAPIDKDFLGVSWALFESPLIALRTWGQTNCRRYSVLNFVIVFLNSPLDSPAWNESEKTRLHWIQIKTIKLILSRIKYVRTYVSGRIQI